MAVVSMKQLLEAGVHFGHQTRRWNPKMAEYIFTERNGIYIIDLQKTVKKLNDAYMFVRDIAAEGGDILFVGTKKQAQDSIKEEAEHCGMPYVNARWLGGMLTNFTTIRSRIARLNQLRTMHDDGTFELLPKKEAVKLNLEIEKLEKFLGGIQEMKKIPGALFIVDPRKEHNAILEARKLNIPVFGIVDTNCDPDDVDYVIPANDDAIRSVALILGVMADAVVESKGGIPVVAYVKDEGESVTMKDVIRQTDKENAEKLARIRAERQARQEAYEKEQAARAAAKDGERKPKTRKPAAKKEAPKAEETKTEGEN